MLSIRKQTVGRARENSFTVSRECVENCDEIQLCRFCKYHYLQIRSPGALNKLPHSLFPLRHFEQYDSLTTLYDREEQTRSDDGKIRTTARNLPCNFTPQLPVSTLFMALRIV